MSDNRLWNPVLELDMSGVWPYLGLRLRSRTCSVQGPDMSMKSYCNPATYLNKSDKGLSHCEEEVDQTCLVQELDMSGKFYWNPTTDPDKPGGLRNLEGPGYVRIFWRVGFKGVFFNNLRFTNSPKVSPLDSTELLRQIKLKIPNP
jgi:hypothetical protein